MQCIDTIQYNTSLHSVSAKLKIWLLRTVRMVTGQNGSEQNGMDKMVYRQNVIGQNVIDKMIWTKWYRQNGMDKMVAIF